MKRLFSLLLLLTFAVNPAFAGWTDRYASASGSGSTCSLVSPCSLSTVLAALVAGDNAYLLDDGGNFNGKFTVSASGTLGNRITIRAYSGEYPVIDGFVTTTLNGSINNSTTTVVVTSAAKMSVGQVITFHDGTEGSEEQCSISNISSNTLTVTRAWNGTTAVSHTNGATVVLGGNQVDVSGSFVTIRDITVINSDPTRVQPPANSQNGPHLRGEGFFNTGDNNEFINCVVHDVQDGIFNSQLASGTIIYGSLFYNNGYVAGGAYNGHGLYLIHEDAGATANIKENIVFNNSNIGIKGDSQNGSTVNVYNEGNIAFNSGAWANDSSRKFNILMSTNNGIAAGITVKDNFFFHISGKNGTNAKLDLASGGTLSVTGNYTGHGIPYDINNSTPIVFTGNTIRATNNTGGGNSTVLLYNPATGPSVTWNNNTYFNSITSAVGYYPSNVSSSRTFAQWKSDTGFDAASSETTSAPGSNWTGARANAYDSNRANAYVYNWTAGSTATISVSGIFNDGDTIAIHVAEEGTFPSGTPAGSVTVSGGNITVPMNGTSVVAQVGQNGSTIVTPTTMRGTFAAFILVRTQSAGLRGGISGKATISGKASINQ